MNKEKISQICTIKNEGSSLREFLDSLISQSRLPDEIIIVDGGSTDNTIEIIKSYNSFPIKFITENGANIAQGRNIAINNSNYEIIASTDAGCIIDKDWLKNLIKPFEENETIDVVSGVYDSIGKTLFEVCVAELTRGNIDNLNAKTFLPSSRSIAFKKTAWEKAGRYPEHLKYAEDTIFDLNLKKVGCNFEIAKDAFVYWRMRKDLKSLFRQYYNYSKWDAIAGICNYRLIKLYLSLAVILLIAIQFNTHYGLLLAIAFFGYYFIRYGIITYLNHKKLMCLYYGPAIVLTLVLSSLLGEIAGMVKK